MTKLDAAKVSVTASMPDSYHFTNIRLLVGIYKILLRAFISIAFMAAGYLRRLANALSEITLYER